MDRLRKQSELVQGGTNWGQSSRGNRLGSDLGVQMGNTKQRWNDWSCPLIRPSNNPQVPGSHCSPTQAALIPSSTLLSQPYSSCAGARNRLLAHCGLCEGKNLCVRKCVCDLGGQTCTLNHAAPSHSPQLWISQIPGQLANQRVVSFSVWPEMTSQLNFSLNQYVSSKHFSFHKKAFFNRKRFN